jgi:hypothetical protein
LKQKKKLFYAHTYADGSTVSAGTSIVTAMDFFGGLPVFIIAPLGWYLCSRCSYFLMCKVAEI